MAGDWNVVATVQGERFAAAKRLLKQAGAVRKTDYYNVLVLTVEDPLRFLEWVGDVAKTDPEALTCIAHLRPAQTVFAFQSSEDFEDEVKAIARAWAPRLAGKSFHARMHRRGFKDRLDSQQVEKLVADTILAALHAEGHDARVSFEHPDAVVSIETVGNRAGMALWSRDVLERCPWLGLA